LPCQTTREASSGLLSTGVRRLEEKEETRQETGELGEGYDIYIHYRGNITGEYSPSISIFSRSE
jgi:hypothetical protein